MSATAPNQVREARLARQLDAGEAGSFTGAGLFFVEVME